MTAIIEIVVKTYMSKNIHNIRTHVAPSGALIPSDLFTERDICQLVRNLGRPLPCGLKARIMQKIHERVEELKKSFHK
jgi:hypothetical protein